MDKYCNIFEKRLDSLIKISINDRHTHGIGVLFLDFTETDKMNAFYLPLNSSHFPNDLISYYNKRITEVPKSMIFFNLFDKENSLNIELDLNEKSGYTEHLLKENGTIKDQ